MTPPLEKLFFLKKNNFPPTWSYTLNYFGAQKVSRFTFWPIGILKFSHQQYKISR